MLDRVGPAPLSGLGDRSARYLRRKGRTEIAAGVRKARESCVVLRSGTALAGG